MVDVSAYALSVLVVILLINFIRVPAMAADSTDLLAGKEPLGKSLEAWATKFWQWNIALPPHFETNSCVMYSVPNSSMVFLINPWTKNYQGNCSIPSDKYILVPLLVGECDTTLPDAKGGKIKDLWACAESADEPFQSWSVMLDNKIISRSWGNDIVNPSLIKDILVRNSTKFSINIPKNNNIDVPPGFYPAVVDGYYLVLKPLSPGEHTLVYAINQKIIGAGMGNISPLVGGSANYKLHVK
jgi:hypothetical protein